MRISDFLYPETIARCQHVKVNGIQCGSPALRNKRLCHFHQKWQQGRIQLNANRARRSRFSLDLPPLEDANSIQVALMQGLRLLLTNQIDHKTAALLFYALQTASSNLRRTNFEPTPTKVVIDARRLASTSLGDDAWYKQEFENEEEEENNTEDDIQDIKACADEALIGSEVNWGSPRLDAFQDVGSKNDARMLSLTSSIRQLRFVHAVSNGVEPT